jgi:CRISPR-associated protein Csb2
MDRELEYLAQRLNGERLEAEGGTEACAGALQLLLSGTIELQKFDPPAKHFINRCYLTTADTWQTVTPVLLHGHDDHKPEKTVKLIQRTLLESGVETSCEFTWQATPFFRHALSAHKYDSQGRRTGYFRPSHLDGYTAVHLRLRFGRREGMGDPESPWTPSRVAGPLVIGAGRYYGFGLLAASQS